ncbi:MAG: hypothetical protein QY323_01210 [Patescibacteria group bacterium]|nr:MAG: hypothetical protein QY323_01210 [Patescibacteria group bacterium]
MERFETPQKPEHAQVSDLAAAAKRLEATVDRKRAPDGHIYAALDQANIRDLAARKNLIGKIKAELSRQRPVPLSKRQDLIEDARRASELHPKEEDES